MTLLKRLAKSIKENGVKYTFRAIFDKIERKIQPFLDSRFDQRFCVDTCGVVPIENLDVSLAKKSEAFYYEPTPVSVLKFILKKLQIDPSKYSFIDFGSGKGRVLLLASEYGYRQIIGVEFCQSLHNVTMNNLAIWNNSRQKCFDIKSVYMDACDFELPSDPLVLFFFTPFKPAVTCQVVQRIKESFDSNPRSIWIIYYGSRQDFVEVLMNLNFTCRQIYSCGSRKALLFESPKSEP